MKLTNPMKMKKTARGICRVAALSGALLLAIASVGHAAPFNYQVTVDVSSLVSDLNGPYSLDLQLVPGSGNVTNTVTISNFVVTGGAFTGSPTFTFGGESGSTSTSVVLTTSSSDNEFAQAFTAGTTKITFNVSESNNAETVTTGTPIPDQFNVAVLDTNLNNIATNDPSGNNELLSHPMNGTQGASQIETYVSTGSDGNGGVTAIPEPGSTTMVCIGGALLAFWAWRRAARPRVCA